METRIKEIRKARGLKQDEVARFIGMSASGYGMIEKGKRRLTSDVLVKLSVLLNVSTDELLGTGFATDSESPQYLLEQKLRATLISATTRLDGNGKAQVQALIESFLDLSDDGRQRLLDTADDMVRSGKYVQVGRTSFSDRDTRVQAAGAA